jgi:hypothetical protein
MQTLMGVLGGASGINFAPTVIGQQEADGIVCHAEADDSNFGPSSASADTSVWLETTASDCFIRVDGFANASSIADVNWFSPVDVDEGTPGTDEDVFVLNQRPDSVNIFTFSLDDSQPDTVHVKIGTFTDDDKSTFFNPTNAVNYGYELQINASDPGDGNQDGSQTIQFTFRKAGLNDLTVLYRTTGNAQADDAS